MSSLRNTYSQITGTEISILLRSMTKDGDPMGDADMAVDGSSVPVEFFIRPEAGLQFISSITSIEVSDSGSPVLDDYGSITGPLTNGIQFFLDIDGVVTDILAPIKSNRELLNLAPVLTRQDYAGNQSLEIYTFDTRLHSNAPVVLNSASGDRFGIRVQDDLSSLIAHSIVTKGTMLLRNI